MHSNTRGNRKKEPGSKRGRYRVNARDGCESDTINLRMKNSVADNIIDNWYLL